MAQKTRPCMLCGQPLDKDGDCHTEGCAYNPADEAKQFEKEEQFDENMHQGGDTEGLDDDLPYYPDTEGLEGDFEDLPEPQGEPQGDPEPEGKEDRERGESDKMDLSNEDDLNENDEMLDEDEPDAEGEGDLDDMTPEQKDKLNEQGQSEPSDEAKDEDSDLPPRPHGCDGNCQPGEVGEDGDPCPHCTAKAFKQEMQDQGKEHLPEEEMEKEMQDFLDNWMQQGEDNDQGQGDQSDDKLDLEEPEPTPEDPPEKQERDQRLQEREAPDLDADDDDLPPRPKGCDGDCQPSDQFDDDADPCPHCTAKQFRDEMQREQELDPDVDPEELADKFQDYLKDWADKQDEQKKKPEGEQKSPDEIDEDPPEDELNDAPPEDEAEQKSDEPDEKKVEHEDEDDEFKRKAKGMTVTQEKRFDNLVDRLAKKVEQTFGQTAEDIYVMAKAEGQFQGEEVSQSIQITSRGVTYWVTLSAAKEI